MARKRSVSGRARGKTIEGELRLQAEKITKRLNQLEKAGEYGKLKAQKDFIRFTQTNRYVSIKRAVRSKRRRVVVDKIQKSMAEQRLIDKEFKTFLKSKVTTPIGIKNARAKQRASLSRTLKGIKGEDVSDEEVDSFIEMAEYADSEGQDSIIEKIGKSEFFALVTDAKEQGMGVPQWINMLNNYVTINNDYMRKQAEELYNRYVA